MVINNLLIFGGGNTAIATFKRYEKKYLITKEQLDGILPLLLEHMELDEYCIGG